MDTATIEEVAITKISPAKYNPRRKLKPGDKEYEDIKASLDTFGLVQPLVWNRRSGNLVGGHQRLNIIRIERPKKKTVQCSVVDLDDKEEKRLNVILNKVGEGLWSPAKLNDLITELAGENADIHRLGFSEDEIEAMIKTKPEPTIDPDDAPAPPKKPLTVHGDVFDFADDAGILTHRLVCGDSTDEATWKKLQDGLKPANLIFTDPPYGVSYQSQSKSKKMARKDLENDKLRKQGLEHFIRDTFALANAGTKNTAAAYVFYASKTHIQFEQGLEAADYEIKQQIIWVKQMALGRADFHWAHEPMLYCQKTGQKAAFHGDRTQTTVWEEMSVAEMNKAIETADNTTIWKEKRDPPSVYIHPTQKPTSLCRKALRLSTFYGDTVVDPFGGSGSTLIAAELEARRAQIIELDPAFAEGIVKRYAQTFPERRITKNGKDLTPEDLSDE